MRLVPFLWFCLHPTAISKSLFKHCETNGDCEENQFCEKSTEECRCSSGSRVWMGGCLRPMGYLQSCQQEEQCRFTDDNLTCLSSYGSKILTCRCKNDYVFKGTLCVPIKQGQNRDASESGTRNQSSESSAILEPIVYSFVSLLLIGGIITFFNYRSMRSEEDCSQSSQDPPIYNTQFRNESYSDSDSRPPSPLEVGVYTYPTAVILNKDSGVLKSEDKNMDENENLSSRRYSDSAVSAASTRPEEAQLNPAAAPTAVNLDIIEQNIILSKGDPSTADPNSDGSVETAGQSSELVENKIVIDGSEIDSSKRLTDISSHHIERKIPIVADEESSLDMDFSITETNINRTQVPNEEKTTVEQDAVIGEKQGKVTSPAKPEEDNQAKEKIVAHIESKIEDKQAINMITAHKDTELEDSQTMHTYIALKKEIELESISAIDTITAKKETELKDVQVADTITAKKETELKDVQVADTITAKKETELKDVQVADNITAPKETEPKDNLAIDTTSAQKETEQEDIQTNYTITSQKEPVPKNIQASDTIAALVEAEATNIRENTRDAESSSGGTVQPWLEQPMTIDEQKTILKLNPSGVSASEDLVAINPPLSKPEQSKKNSPDKFHTGEMNSDIEIQEDKSSYKNNHAKTLNNDKEEPKIQLSSLEIINNKRWEDVEIDPDVYIVSQTGLPQEADLFSSLDGSMKPAEISPICRVTSKSVCTGSLNKAFEPD